VDVPRGPDVLHRIRVPAEWLEAGEIVELELPRNMKCADCEGGGCDRCGRAGAISIRGRNDLTELVQVTLPKRDENSEPASSGRALVLRIPNRGGVSDDPELPRGLLLLSVVPADVADPGVSKVEPLPEPAVEQELAEAFRSSEAPIAGTPPAGNRMLVRVVLVLVILWVLFLIWMRATGRA